MLLLFLDFRLDSWVSCAQHFLSLIAKEILFLILLGEELIEFKLYTLIAIVKNSRKFTNSDAHDESSGVRLWFFHP